MDFVDWCDRALTTPEGLEHANHRLRHHGLVIHGQDPHRQRSVQLSRCNGWLRGCFHKREPHTEARLFASQGVVVADRSPREFACRAALIRLIWRPAARQRLRRRVG
jgi:hypothetical protein